MEWRYFYEWKVIVGNDLLFPKLNGLAKKEPTVVKVRGKEAEKIAEEAVSGRKQKRDVGRSEKLNELQISNYFEKARKESHEDESVDGSEEDGQEDLEDTTLEKGPKGNVIEKGTTVHAPAPKNTVVHQQGPSDENAAILQLTTKDAATQVDPKSAPQHAASSTDPIHAQQWANDMLTDPPLQQKGITQPLGQASQIPKPKLESVQTVSYQEAGLSPTNSTDRLISYAESLLPGRDSYNSHPTRVLFSLDDDGIPSVWGDSYNPGDPQPDLRVPLAPQADLEDSKERVVEYFMYPIVEGDQVRYVTGPKPDPNRKQVWTSAQPIYDETTHTYAPEYYIRERPSEEGGFKAGKLGVIGLGERVPLIREGANYRNRYEHTLEALTQS